MHYPQSSYTEVKNIKRRSLRTNRLAARSEPIFERVSGDALLRRRCIGLGGGDGRARGTGGGDASRRMSVGLNRRNNASILVFRVAALNG